MKRAPHVVLVCGYFDWFSGYQEVGLARALTRVAQVTVVAGDRVNPLFTDNHLAALGVRRRYRTGTSVEEGVRIVRLECRESRSMLWARGARRAVEAAGGDVVIQVMPGQVLPAAASWSDLAGPRFVLYGDNSAMYAGLTPWLQKVKTAVFLATKGLLYRHVNGRATSIYGYTPNTIDRLRSVSGPHSMQLLPLAYDGQVFTHSPEQRASWRRQHRYEPSETVVIVAGKVQRQKRADAVIQAVARLVRSGTAVRLHVVGVDDGPTGTELVRLTDELGIQDSVKFEGFLPASDLARAFNGADIGVWPSMPAITIQQAMGTGLSVVLPDNDLVAHLLDHRSLGRLIAPGADLIDSIDEALREVIADSAQTVPERAARAKRAEWLSTDASAGRLLRDAGLVHVA